MGSVYIMQTEGTHFFHTIYYIFMNIYFCILIHLQTEPVRSFATHATPLTILQHLRLSILWIIVMNRTYSHHYVLICCAP